jgi:hypothetical protein
MENIQSILSELGFKTVEEAARKRARLIILGKMSKYQAEYNSFKQKYNCEYDEFEKGLSEINGKEDFDIEDDFMECQFATKLLKKYTKQEELLSHA